MCTAATPARKLLHTAPAPPLSDGFRPRGRFGVTRDRVIEARALLSLGAPSCRVPLESHAGGSHRTKVVFVGKVLEIAASCTVQTSALVFVAQYWQNSGL